MARSSSKRPSTAAAATAVTTTTTTDDAAGPSNGTDDNDALGFWFFFGVFLLLGTIAVVALFARDIDMFKAMPPPGLSPPGFSCTVLGRGEGLARGGFVGVEDITLVSEGKIGKLPRCVSERWGWGVHAERTETLHQSTTTTTACWSRDRTTGCGCGSTPTSGPPRRRKGRCWRCTTTGGRMCRCVRACVRASANLFKGSPNDSPHGVHRSNPRHPTDRAPGPDELPGGCGLPPTRHLLPPVRACAAPSSPPPPNNAYAWVVGLSSDAWESVSVFFRVLKFEKVGQPHPFTTMSGSRESHKLYVINHAYAKGGERVDVFKVTVKGKDGKVGEQAISLSL